MSRWRAPGSTNGCGPSACTRPAPWRPTPAEAATFASVGLRPSRPRPLRSAISSRPGCTAARGWSRSSGPWRSESVRPSRRSATSITALRHRPARASGRCSHASAAPVDVFIGDLALMSEVRKVAAELLDRYERIDVLVNNAGIQLRRQQATSEGLPEMVAVNYLAPWLLTSLLRERLVASAPARVVVTASEAHRVGWSVDTDRILTDISPFG